MPWLKATIEFGSAFSYRVPDFSSQYALSSLLPSPLAVKLGLVSTAIQYRGVEFGRGAFDLIKDKKVGFRIKGRMISNCFLIKRLKAKKGGGGLESTFGIRGYIFYESPLEIWVEEVNEKLAEIFRRLRYLGTSDSLCSVITESDNPSNDLIFSQKELNQNLKNSLIIPTKDLHSQDKFEDINIYIPEKKPKLEKKFFQIPLKSINQSKNWTVYEVGR